MLLSSYISVLAVVVIGHVTGDHEFGEKVYQEMCSDTEFQEGIIQCLSSMPTRDQLIYKLCGSVCTNETLEDYTEIVLRMCSNGSHAIKSLICIHEISHVMMHLSEPHDHDHEHDHEHHDHEHDHEHHHHHHGHHDHDHEHEGSDDHENDDHDHHEHEHHHHHHPHHYFGHTFLSQGCFRQLYEAYNFTIPASSEKTSSASSEEEED